MCRYQSALSHYQEFVNQPEIVKAWPHAVNINRDFQLAFGAFLASRQIRPNGRGHGQLQPMKGQSFVSGVIHAMLEWAADPEAGRLLPDTFRNPFLKSMAPRRGLKGDPLAEPDITLSMAIDLIRACDHFQLRLFAPMLLFGLRATEPCYLFVEHLDNQWLRVPCLPELSYYTKGRRGKRFPLLQELQGFWHELLGPRTQGLLYERRAVVESRDKIRIRGAALPDMVAEYRLRCDAVRGLGAAQREHLRDAVLHDAGGLSYDHIENEFAILAQQLQWPAQATLKDLRHLFATTMNNASMPEAYRR